MAVTLVAPELLMGKALSDLYSARDVSASAQKFVDDDSVPWTILHSFLANMGGFSITFGEEVETNLRDSDSEIRSDDWPDQQACESNYNESSNQVEESHHDNLGDGDSSHTQEGRGTGTAQTDSAEGNVPLPMPYNNGDLGNTQDERETGTAQTASAKGDIPLPEPCNITPQAYNNTSSKESVISRSSNEEEDTSAAEKADLDKKREKPDRETIELRQRLAKWRTTKMQKVPHTHFRNLRGFALFGRRIPNAENQHKVIEALNKVKYTDIPICGPQRTCADLPWYVNVAALQNATWIMDGPQLLCARELGIIKRLPAMPQADLMDKSKGSEFIVNGIAIVQLSWLIIQLIARAAQRLPVIQLEIVTMSFSACSVVTFALIWNKPKDIEVPMSLKASRAPTVDEIIQVAARGPMPWFTSGESLVRIHENVIHCECRGSPRYSFRHMSVGIAAGSLIFGSLHLLAWNLAFPTSIERILWRVAAIVTTTVPTFCTIVILINRRPGVGTGMVARHSAYFAAITLTLARLFLTVEVIRTLFFLPPRAFVATWSSNLPHLG